MVIARSLRGHYAVTTQSHYAVTTRSPRAHYSHYAVTTVTTRSPRGHHAVTTHSQLLMPPNREPAPKDRTWHVRKAGHEKMAEADRRRKIIRQVYTNPRTGFGNLDQTLRQARARDQTISRSEVRQFLNELIVRQDRPNKEATTVSCLQSRCYSCRWTSPT